MRSLRRFVVGALVVGNVAVLTATSPRIEFVSSPYSEPLPIALDAGARDAELTVSSIDPYAHELSLSFQLENALPGTGLLEIYESMTPWEAPPGEDAVPVGALAINGAWGEVALTSGAVRVADPEGGELTGQPRHYWLTLVGDDVEAVGDVTVSAARQDFGEPGPPPATPVIE